jgi:hypothetical protein
MRKLRIAAALLAAIFFFSSGTRAQSPATVTATVTDANGTPCSNGTVIVSIAPTGTSPTVGGQPISGTTTAGLDITGTFSMSLYKNTDISPAGTHWTFQVNCNSGLPAPVGTGGQTAIPAPQSITTNPTSLSATISAALPLLTNIHGSGSPAFSAITTGINTTATMTVGTGATLTFSGAGVINASECNGGACGGVPGTPVNAVQFNSPLGTFAGDSQFLYVGSSHLLTVGAPISSLSAFAQGFLDLAGSNVNFNTLYPAGVTGGSTGGVSIISDVTPGNGDTAIAGLLVVAVNETTGSTGSADSIGVSISAVADPPTGKTVDRIFGEEEVVSDNNTLGTNGGNVLGLEGHVVHLAHGSTGLVTLMAGMEVGSQFNQAGSTTNFDILHVDVPVDFFTSNPITNPALYTVTNFNVISAPDMSVLGTHSAALLVAPYSLPNANHVAINVQGALSEFTAGIDSQAAVTITQHSGTQSVPVLVVTGKAQFSTLAINSGVCTDGSSQLTTSGCTFGSGTVTSVSFTGGLISVANPTTTPAFTVAGTSGGVPYFASSSTWASSAALPSGDFVLGGGAGSAPTATFSIVPVANGGNGTASPGLVAGTNITITGSWPNQTINSSGGGSGTINAAAQYSDAYYSASGSATTISGVAPPTAVTGLTYVYTSTGTTPAWAIQGVSATAAQTSTYTFNGAGASGTGSSADQGFVILANPSAARVYTIPQASTTGFANAPFWEVYNENSSFAVTLTPTTSTINGNATALVPPLFDALIYTASGGTNYLGVVFPTIGAFPNCTDSGGNHLNFTSATGVFSCGTTASVAGTVTSVSFTGGLISVASPTTTPAFTVAGTSGGVVCFTAAATWGSSGALTANVLTKGGGAGVCPSNSSITDNGTTITTSEPIATTSTLAAGSSPPTCTPGTAGAICLNEGTAPTPASAVDQIYADSTFHTFGILVNGGSAGIVVEGLPGSIQKTGQTALISTATLCASSAGACAPAGEYHVHLAMEQAGTACSANTTNGVAVQLTWTDKNGVTHSAVTIPLLTSASLIATSGTMAWPASGVTAYASADFNLFTNGSIIQYATTYSNCTTGGTAAYDLAITVTAVGRGQ